ncbi:hypothetical protein ABIA20_000509 [Sinorhizobium fredii]
MMYSRLSISEDGFSEVRRFSMIYAIGNVPNLQK